MNRPLRVLELFSGIGGCAAALQPACAEGTAEVVAAVEISPLGRLAYEANFSHPVFGDNLEFVSQEKLRAWAADLWWMSPPCQPYTRRGHRRDEEDPRSRPLFALLAHFLEIQPRYLAIENVPGFAQSRSLQKLRKGLSDSGYRIQDALLCPSELGIPNRRRRFFLLASRPTGETGPTLPLETKKAPPWPLSRYLDSNPAQDLYLASSIHQRYTEALHIVEPKSPGALSACFTSAYGRSFVRSGSYLMDDEGIRRFSPAEILRLLGYPSTYHLPEPLSREQAWRLVGNSLSIPVVRRVLSALPELRDCLGHGLSEPGLPMPEGLPG
ncbi:MAG: DNA cytosine methyltransferase [Deltaproteobacteria bacterium]|nr:DNA cytosine methyltransferase [Deltaproteobacteria bacterium]